MSLATRLIAALQEQLAALPDQPALTTNTPVVSLAVIGSLARDDFRVGGSDVDFLVVHTLGDQPASVVGADPAVRGLVHHFGGPLLRLAGGTGVQKPFVVDCHFVDSLTLSTQPRWADPAHFTLAHAGREPYLWLFAFDLLQHILPLYGPNPAAGVTVYEPADYTAVLRQQLQRDLGELLARTDAQSNDTVNAWKRFSGYLLTTLSLRHGGHSLLKSEVHKAFSTRVPHFTGKDFAASLWAEYLYGSVFQDRADWLRRCRRFCENGLAVL